MTMIQLKPEAFAARSLMDPLAAPSDFRFNCAYLARCASAAYFADEADLARQLRELTGLESPIAFAERAGLGLQGYGALSPDGRFAALAIRGTANIENWILTNPRAKLVQPAWRGGEPGRAHEGFLAALDALWPELRRIAEAFAKRDAAIWLAGHSLGGAVAVLAALRLQREEWGEAVRGIVTIGQPRAGERELANSMRPVWTRVANASDAVPLLPPGGSWRQWPPSLRGGYSHGEAARFLWFDHFGNPHLNPRAWLTLADRALNRAISDNRLDWLEDHYREAYLRALDGLLLRS